MAKTLLEVISENNFTLLQSGDRWVMRCPFHEGDHSPSFTVYPTQTYFCFGCKAWGDAFKFLKDFKQWDNTTIQEYLGEDYKSVIENKPKIIKVRNVLETYKFIYDVAEEYHKFLLKTPGALQYLQNRGLTMDTITTYKIGYTDGHVLHPYWALEQKIANEIGLINKGGYETLSHRITIPNITDDGYADFIIGRTVTNDKVKYLGLRIAKPIYGFYEIRKSPVIFLAEGQFDWLTLRQWGYPAAVLSGGNLSRSNLILLRDKKVVIIPDLDDSGIGMDTAKTLKEQLGESAQILDYSELQTSKGKLDISTLGESPGSKELFDIIVKEQCPWIMFMRTRILTKWFPHLVSTIPSHLTLKLQV